MNTDLANMVNMAAVKAAVDGVDKITTKQLEFAKDKLLMGTERKSMALTEESRKVTHSQFHFTPSISNKCLLGYLKFLTFCGVGFCEYVVHSWYVSKLVGLDCRKYRHRLVLWMDCCIHANRLNIQCCSLMQLTAYHESGHAVVAFNTQGANPIHKATIMPRGMSLGMVTQLPDKDETSVSKRQMLARLDVCMGGRVAEEMVFGPDQVTSGARSDLQQATALARHMVSPHYEPCITF